MRQSEAGTVLAGALMLRVTAFVVLSPIAGAIADRVDRKRLMIITHLARMVIVCLLPFVTQIWQIYAIVLSLNVFYAFFAPTYTATIPLVTTAAERSGAIAGIGQTLVNVPTQTLIAERVVVEVQGRVYGAHFAWSHLWWAFAYPLAGWMGSSLPTHNFFYKKVAPPPDRLTFKMEMMMLEKFGFHEKSRFLRDVFDFNDSAKHPHSTSKSIFTYLSWSKFNSCCLSDR